MVRRLAFLIVCCAGCSLDEGSLGQTPGPDAATPDVIAADVTSNDVTTNDVVAPDVATDAIEEPGPPLACSTDASACSGAVPAGWTLTAFAPNRTTACPGNFTATDVVAAPTLQAGACTCSCNIATQPSCALGAVTGTWSGDANCGNAWKTWTFTAVGQCMDYGMGANFALGSHNSYTKLGLTPGTCNSPAAVADGSKVGSTPMRTCVPSVACAEDVCNGAVPAGMRACIATAGDVACPAGPFSDKAAVIGATTTLSCAGCSTCNVTQSACGAATVKFWADANCTQAKGSVAADGNCNATGSVSTTHFTYENPVQNVQCNAGTSAPTADLGTKRTVCCRL